MQFQREVSAHSRDGFALPAVLVCLAALGILAAGGLQAALGESWAARASESGVRAYWTASAGLAQLHQDAASLGENPILTYTFGRGEAETSWVRLIEVDSLNQLVVLTSRGRWPLPLRGDARRTLTQVAYRNPSGELADRPGSWREVFVLP